MTVIDVQRRWFFSMHAMERMRQMDLDREQILSIINDPDVSYPSQDRRVAVRDGLAIVYEADRVITILLHLQEQWTR